MWHGHHSTTNQIKPSNVDAGWGPKYFWFYRDIWRSSDVPTNSFLSIEIYTICYLAICDCLQLDSKPKIILKLRKKHDICYINVKQNACFLRLSPESGRCYLSPFGTWYCTQFTTWAKSFVDKFIKLTPICHEFVKKCEK